MSFGRGRSSARPFVESPRRDSRVDGLHGSDLVAQALELQRSAGNAAVARLLGSQSRAVLQRDAGWKGDDVMADRNKGMTEVASDRPGGKAVRRIPIEGIDEGHAAGDTKPEAEATGVDETGSYRPMKELTEEKAGGQTSGRAVVLIPDSLPPLETVEVLFHLHGFTPGWRARIPKQPPKPKPKARRRGQPPPVEEPAPPPIPIEPEDIATARIEQQLEESGRPMIGILPQGTARAVFGHDRAEVNMKTYIDQVFQRLTDKDWPSGKKPQHVGGIVLSGHSGGGKALSSMLHSKEHLVPGTDRPAEAEDPGKKSVTDTAYLESLVLFDTINPAGETTGTTQYTHVLEFLTSQLVHELAQLHDMWKLDQAAGTADDEIARKQEKWLGESGFRFRGFATAGGYGESFDALDGQVKAWLASHAQVLGGRKSCVFKALSDNFKVTPAGTDHMHMIGGAAGKDGTLEHENLRSALDALPKPASGGRKDCEPSPAKPLPKPAPKPAKKRREAAVP